MNRKRKDPKKVAAGRKGGRLSGANFKRNREAAMIAGQKSAWLKGERKLQDFPIPLIDNDGTPIAFEDKGGERRRK